MYLAAGFCHCHTAMTIAIAQTNGVARKTATNNERTAITLIDCIAAMLWLAGICASPFITKVENAKNTPAISPQLNAEKSVKAKIKFLIVNIKSPSD